MKNYGMFLLGAWLVARSVLDLLNIHFSYDETLLAAIALVAGILLLMNELKSKLESSANLLLGIWLVAGAAMKLFGFSFPSSHLAMAVLASLAGVLLIFKP